MWSVNGVDITRLLRRLGDVADMEYMRASTESVGVQDLLERLLLEVDEASSRRVEAEQNLKSALTEPPREFTPH